MTKTEREKGLARLARQFMTPDIDGPVDVWQVETSIGTELVPCDVSNTLANIAVYVEGTVVTDQETGEPVAERLTSKYIARLSAAGYLDCTDWSVHDTRTQAEEYLVETYYEGYDDDQDTDDDSDSEEDNEEDDDQTEEED
jgi:hypothetical protein